MNLVYLKNHLYKTYKGDRKKIFVLCNNNGNKEKNYDSSVIHMQNI